MWTLHIHPGVTAYVYSLRLSGRDISAGIRAIASEDRPWDEDRPVQHRPGRYERFVAGHWVTYHVNEQEKIIRILVVESN